MLEKFAYSYNGENYRGSFDSRQEAYERALSRMGGFLTLPQTIYVGKISAADPHASGLARTVVNDMASRARLDGVTADFLGKVSEEQLNELDATLETIVRGWLYKNDLMPEFFKVDAISEHPLPPTPAVHGESVDEVTELGASGYPVEQSTLRA